MIKVTRLDGSILVINSDLVEYIEKTPDTVVTLINGHKMVARESVEELVDRVIEFRKRINLCPLIKEQSSAEMVQRLAGRNLDM